MTGSSLHLHLFLENKNTTRVFLSMLPGSIQDLELKLKALANRESFPNVSYTLQHPTLQEKYAKLFPPADLLRHFGIYPLGVVNSILMNVATEGIQPKVDPEQYVDSIR